VFRARWQGAPAPDDEGCDEAHLSAEAATSREAARLPPSDGDACRQGDLARSATQAAGQAYSRLIGTATRMRSLRGQAAFEQLGRDGLAVADEALRVRWHAGAPRLGGARQARTRSPGEATQSGPSRGGSAGVRGQRLPDCLVAAVRVPRRAGNAVVRNRIRRRVRSALLDLEREGAAVGTYVVTAGPAVASMPYETLVERLRVLFERLAAREVHRRSKEGRTRSGARANTPNGRVWAQARGSAACPGGGPGIAAGPRAGQAGGVLGVRDDPLGRSFEGIGIDGPGPRSPRLLGRRVAAGIVRLYQAARLGRPSPCRFVPSCSEYARLALVEHGVVRGTLLALRRLGRCRPRGGFGFDPVPSR
jgi:ribonuclease P protein component